MKLEQRVKLVVQRIAQDVKAILNSLTNYYDKTEVDGKLDLKADKSNTYTKSETDSQINTKVAGLYKPKGSKPTYADLPTSGNKAGDVWNVESDGKNYAWVGGSGGENGDGWDALGGTIDLSDYSTTAQADNKYALKTRTISAGTGLTGGGSLASNRTLSVDFGTAAGKVAQGNDSRFHTHSNKTILDAITAAFTTALKTKLDGIETGANKYVLPNATASVLGGVKQGANITIANGVISTHAPYTHPTTAGNKHIPTGGAAGEFLKYKSSGTAEWKVINDTDIESSTDYVAIYEAALL